jgi:hypothetical protein
VRSLLLPTGPSVSLTRIGSVTLAYDEVATEQLPTVFSVIDVQPAQYGSTTIAVGSVGPHGTVLRGKDLAVIRIAPPAP